MTVVRFPTSGWKRTTNRRGKRSVSCVVTDRFLRFDEKSDKVPEGTVVKVSVMTEANDKEAKLCDVFVTLQELRRVLDLYEQDKSHPA